jgi:hypothetical protein
MRSGEVGGGEWGPSHKGATSVAPNVHGPPQKPFLLTREYSIINLSQCHRRTTGSDSPPFEFMVINCGVDAIAPTPPRLLAHRLSVPRHLEGSISASWVCLLAQQEGLRTRVKHGLARCELVGSFQFAEWNCLGEDICCSFSDCCWDSPPSSSKNATDDRDKR